MSFRMGWRNHVLHEDAALSVLQGTVSAGALSALQDMRLSKRVTITATESGGVAYVEIEWKIPSGVVAVDLLGLLNYSVSSETAPIVTVSLSASGPSGSYTENVIWSRPSADFPLHAWAFSGARVMADTVNVLITALVDPGNTLTVTAGGLWASPAWYPSEGIAATWSQAIVDRGTMGRSEGGQGYPRRRQRYRSFEGRAIQVPFVNAFGDPDDPNVLDIQQLLFRVGTTEPVALFPRTQDAAGVMSTHVMHRLGIYGHMAETGRIEHLGGDLYQWTGARVDELM